MKLPEYIKLVGDEALATMVGVTKFAVRSWRTGERTPRPEQARKIVEKTPLTMDDIYGK